MQGVEGLDIKKYEVFVRTVELSSLTHAAQSLGMTQSGVSHIIAAVEDELGLSLLSRTRTGARLTEEGERIYPMIRQLVNTEKELKFSAESLRGVIGGQLRIGSFTSVATHWLPAMLQEFQSLHPQVVFKLFNGDYQDVQQWIDERSVDVSFVALPIKTECEWVALGEDRLMAILPKGHPLSLQERCDVQQILAEPFISLIETTDQDVRRVIESAGGAVNARFTTKDDYAIIAMVAQGLGVSIMPELLLRGYEEKLEIRPLNPAFSRTLALAFPNGERTNSAARSFADFSVQWVKRNGFV